MSMARPDNSAELIEQQSFWRMIPEITKSNWMREDKGKRGGSWTIVQRTGEIYNDTFQPKRELEIGLSCSALPWGAYLRHF